VTDREHLIATQLGDITGPPRVRRQVRTLVKQLRGQLAPDEELVNLAAVELRRKIRLLAVTDCRLLVVASGRFRARVESYPFDQIDRIQHRPDSQLVSLVIGEHDLPVGVVHSAERLAEIIRFVRQQVGTTTDPSE
jgi:hypothetical protein